MGIQEASDQVASPLPLDHVGTQASTHRSDPSNDLSMNTVSVTIPPLGRDGVSVQLVSWSKAVGDAVLAAEPLGFLQVDAEAFFAEIPSPSAGVVAALHAFPGDPIRVGQVVAHIQVEEPGRQAVADLTVLPGVTAPRPVSGGFAPAIHATGPRAWTGLAVAAACLVAMAVAGPRDDETTVLRTSVLGLAFFALATTAPKWWPLLRGLRRVLPSGFAWHHVWLLVSFVAAAIVPHHMATTQPLAGWFAHSGYNWPDGVGNALPPTVMAVVGSYLAVNWFKPRGLAAVGLAAIGALLLVFSSTKDLNTQNLLFVGIFVAWPVFAFVEYARYAPLMGAARSMLDPSPAAAHAESVLRFDPTDVESAASDPRPLFPDFR
jgi:pyruvate/2-oxoglutarate dehydrogenase complex dihydrolipoamide acyltransferase (E2) component